MQSTTLGLLSHLLAAILSAPTQAGITVTSYETTALTNGFAPFSLDQYIAQQTLTNISPATAQVSGDWTGPNSDGTPDTWHFVGSSSVASTTTFDVNTFTATASGSFTYTIDTTTGFVDPRAAGGVFTPSGAVDYRAVFQTDVPLQYTITGQLNQWSSMRLSTPSGFIFDRFNTSTTPRFVKLNGTLGSGQYQLVFNASLAVPNFPNGVNHNAASGGYENVTFTVQVPEPLSAWTAIELVALQNVLYRRRRRDGAVTR